MGEQVPSKEIGTRLEWRKREADGDGCRWSLVLVGEHGEEFWAVLSSPTILEVCSPSEPAQPLTTLSSPRSALWRHMHDEHGLTLLESELDEIELLAKACSADEPQPAASKEITLQAQVAQWMLACFGEEIARDRTERNHRFVEEALELAQANGCTASEAHQLVDYVFSRPAGDLAQEVGGVMVTLAALCNASDANIDIAARDEITRVWTKIDQIRAKQAAKPKHSPLPSPTPEPPAVQIGTHPMIDVMLICDAYESGMGQGLKNKPMGEYRNPYDPVHDKHTYRAYSLGYDEGVKRAAQPPPDDAAERLLMFIYNDQFTSPSREAFCRMFDYFQQKGPTATKGDGQ